MWRYTFLFIFSLITSASVQSSPLLEACNNINDATKRLECLKEACQKYSSPRPNNQYKLREAIVAIDSNIQASTSLAQFRNLRQEFVRELGMFKAGPDANKEIVELLSEALQAYTDAEKFWTVNIREGGSNGLLSPSDMDSYGMGGFVIKYGIPLTNLNWNKWIHRKEGLISIWRYAKERTDKALMSLN
ncbi:MAG: hypothetical protein Q8O37_13160 [Sulfuricellaceae bacterium]|nr:hypothetical protein [Sulfuricellaceae bacterium]